MSASSSTLVRLAGRKSPGVVSRFLAACRQGMTRAVARRRAIAHLRELDAEGLRDIGLHRYEIEAAVRGLEARPGREGAR